MFFNINKVLNQLKRKSTGWLQNILNIMLIVIYGDKELLSLADHVDSLSKAKMKSQ